MQSQVLLIRSFVFPTPRSPPRNAYAFRHLSPSSVFRPLPSVVLLSDAPSSVSPSASSRLCVTSIPQNFTTKAQRTRWISYELLAISSQLVVRSPSSCRLVLRLLPSVYCPPSFRSSFLRSSTVRPPFSTSSLPLPHFPATTKVAPYAVIIYELLAISYQLKARFPSSGFRSLPSVIRHLSSIVRLSAVRFRPSLFTLLSFPRFVTKTHPLFIFS